MWTREGDHYVAVWGDGATAILTVQRFTATQLVFGRADYGKNVDFVATYSGIVTGSTAAGQVTFLQGGIPRTGIFKAAW